MARSSAPVLALNEEGFIPFAVPHKGASFDVGFNHVLRMGIFVFIRHRGSRAQIYFVHAYHHLFGLLLPTQALALLCRAADRAPITVSCDRNAAL